MNRNKTVNDKSPVNSDGYKNIYLEGNIASGKTTLLEYLKDIPSFKIYPEPIEKWQNYKGENLLQLLYQDPKKNTFKFQLGAMETIYYRDCIVIIKLQISWSEVCIHS